MTTRFKTIRSMAALALMSGFLAAPAAFAQAPGSAARMQAEKAVCDGVQQDRAACLREAGAARQEAARGGLTGASPGGYDANAMARCQLQPTADRADCEARLKGSSTPGATTTTGGSVMGGGVIHETVTPVPAPAPSR